MSLPVTTLDPHLYSETNSETMKSGREGMAGGCSIRAMWILNNQDIVVFSRRFSVVERRWRAACTSENVSAAGDADDVKHDVLPLLPTDSELAAAFSDRKKREGSARGFGIRIHQSAEGSDSWVDDPITRHILGLYINKEEEGGKYLLWPLILHIKSHFCIVVLPLVEPFHLREYARLGKRSDCGNAVGTDGSVSSFLLDLPSITGYGTPLDLSYSNISAIKLYGFASSDLPPADRKQPAWKPYLYKGKQRIIFTIHEAVHAAMYDRDDLPDTLSIFGQVNCRAELEGLPDVSFPMTGLDMARIEVLSFHPCAQVPEPRLDKQVVVFSPPLGNFVLMRYLSSRGIGPPVKGFYQLSMVSENEGAFLFKLRLMDGYKSPLTMEFCTVTMPFPRRRVISFDGTPSIGTISMSDYLVEWKIIASGRGIVGKSIEATFSGTVKFAAWQTQKLLSSGSVLGSVADEDSDTETETTNNVVNVEDFLMEKMNKDLPPVDLEEPFCWQAYDYAKVSFKIVGASLSGMSIDPKSVTIFPSVKAPVEFSTQVTSGDYILWNTLGKCPSAATPTPEQ
ncbi:AP-5 complex subunit mu isoform X2 [Diospyros lotus]|uniref:AP-5 complex subunit mu isoform X2 n=1 Tax=Diospyros lotus TaxID=55363 RepID=UPI002251A4C6|nr:AP-5 complex subunit mu isoform X2 [Diospyros lotus]